jgi:tetratricopeptide (TPR) repeat protein
MDGGALLNSLEDWTIESHPNTSLEARQRNNDLMGELRTELFTLLGTTTQVGGSECIDGISIVQPIDETLVRQLSPAELTYRLNLAETNMVGGGGGTGNSIGFMHKLKIMMGFRKFNQFVDDFEKLRAQINKNMAGYEVEVTRGKSLTDAIVTDIRQIFLNEKLRVMWTIIKAQENTNTGLNAVKSGIFDQRIKRVQLEIDRLKIKLAVNVEEAQKVFLVKGIISKKYGSTRGALFWKKGNFMDKTIAEVTAQEHAYLKLDKEMNYFMKEIEHAKNLKLLEAAAGGKNASELTKQQRKEIAEFQKNREKYEKMFAFGETRRDEYEQIMNKKEKLVMELNFFKETITAGTYMKKHTEMQTLLNNWDKNMVNVYSFLTTAITNSGDYKKALDELRGLVADNGNNISKLTAGKSEFEDLKKEYDKYLEQCDKAYEIQESVHNALGEIKEKFKELIPDASLLPDMFRVVQAQAFVLSLVNDVIAPKQNELGGTADKGMKYLQDKLKKMKGGSGGGHTNNANTDDMHLELQQTGGIFVSPVPDYMAPHGNAFYDHDDTGRVYDMDKVGGAGYEDPAPAAGKAVKILTLPYGLRRISQEYVDKVNQAISQIDTDKRIYIPLLNYGNLNRDQVIILTAVYQPDSGIFRVTGVTPTRLINHRGYQRIADNYYFYNIVEKSGNAASDNEFRTEFTKKCDLLPKIMLDAKQYIILPMFYRIGDTSRTYTINNPLFSYNEYVILHPLLGSVMTATLSEAALAPIRDNTGPGVTHGYDFLVANQVLNLRLKMHQNPILPNNPARLQALTNTDNYYYNFCGTDLIKKAQSAALVNYFTTTNYSNRPILFTVAGIRATGAPGNLQHAPPAPPKQPDFHLHSNDSIDAQYAHYMFQLTGHLNELTNKIANTKLQYHPAKLTPDFNGTYDDPHTYDIPYNIAPASVGRVTITMTPNLITKLDHIGSGKQWDNHYLDDFFDTHHTNELVWIFHSIKMLIGDIIYNIRTRSWPLKDAKSGMSLTLYSATYTSALTAAGVSPSSAGIGGTKAGSPGALSPYNPRFKILINYLRNALPDNSSYWSNLSEMTNLIKKFSSPDYQTYSNLLFQTYDIMQIVRKYEVKILDIKAEKDKMPLPEYSLIAKNLEPNVQPGSKDAYTGAGQKLYEKIKENKAYIKQNEFAVNSDNLVRDAQDLLLEIKDLKKVDLELHSVSFFTTSPGDKYYDTLRTSDGASKFIKQLETDKFFSKEKDKVCYTLQKLLYLKPGEPAYTLYEANALRYRDYLGKQGNKKGNKNKKGHTNRKNTH